MFREMRRINQNLSQEEVIEILKKGNSGVLALLGDEDYPYAVPMSYIFHENKLYFHCAKTGHKIDAIEKWKKASFCVIEQDQVIPEEYTTYFRSVIAFGNIHVMEDEKEKRTTIEILMKKYSPNMDEEQNKNEINKAWKSLCMLEFNIEHMTGKEAKELVRRKNEKM